MNEMIVFKNIYKKFQDLKVLEDFNLAIAQGEFLCIVGASGSGKTTIIKMINGLIKADEGEILIDGINLDDLDLIKLRKSIGYVIQGDGLFPHLNIKDNISYVLKLEKYSPKEIDVIVDEMLNLVGLDLKIKTKYPYELSGGQKQRVQIARAYANKPKILLMDEPFGAVDSIVRYQLQNDLKHIHTQNQLTTIFITHDINEAKKLATKILVLNQGKIQQYSTKQQLFKQPENSYVKKLIEMSKS